MIQFLSFIGMMIGLWMITAWNDKVMYGDDVYKSYDKRRKNKK